MIFQKKYHRWMIFVWVVLMYVLFRYLHEGFVLTALHESFLYVTLLPFLWIHYIIQNYHVDVGLFQFYYKRTKKVWIQTLLNLWLSSFLDMMIMCLSVYIIFQWHMNKTISIIEVIKDIVYMYGLSMIFLSISRYRLMSYVSYIVWIFRSFWLPYVTFFHIPDRIDTYETYVLLGILAMTLSWFKFMTFTK